MLKRKPKTKKTSEVDLKTSTQNLMLNVIIFVLFVVVIYLSYSIFIKLKLETTEKQVHNNNKEVPAEIIQLEVLNGCGVSGLAERFTDYLREQQFDVVNKGNYIQYDIIETMVIDRIGNIANAKKVALALGIDPENTFTQINEDYFLDVSIIIGADYYKLSPLK